MAAKKTEVIFGIAVLTVLVNIVSSELLYTAQILKHIPDYDSLTGKNGEGEFLDYQLINEKSKLSLGYATEANGLYLDLISAELIKTRSQKGASLEIIQEEPNSCGQTPGIKASPRKRQSLSSCFNCLAPKTLSNEESTSLSGPNSQEYCFTELSIKIKNRSSSPSLMKLSLKFYDKEKKNSIGVYMMMFETPTTEEDIQITEKHNVFVLDTISFIENLSEISTDVREVMRERIMLKGKMPWLKDVLDRAKYIESVKVSSMSGTYIDWYYAGAVMMDPETFSEILNLEPRWQQYIRKDDKK